MLGSLYFLILFTFIHKYLIGCLFLIAFHEFLLAAFSGKIFENGWIETPDMKEIFTDTNFEEDLEYYALLFVPIINLFCVWDVIYKITHKAEK